MQQVPLDYAFFKQAVVRDLAWACFSPSLLAEGEYAAKVQAFSRPYTPQDRDFLCGLDQNPQPLLMMLQNPPCHLLGVYFERLWRFYLSYGPHSRLLGHNIQLHQGAQTLGEMDFIYECQLRGQTVHMEVAVKYYLGIYQATDTYPQEPRYWLGPATHDRLDIKLDKMLQQQCLLSRTPSGTAQLQALSMASCVQEVLIKGRLFYPATLPAIVPTSISIQHLTGLWLRQADWVNYFTESSSNWFMLEKPNWFAIDLSAITPIKTIQTWRKPVYLIQQTHHVNWQHYFVVPNDWPQGIEQ